MHLNQANSIQVRKIIPEEERMRALMAAVKNRENKMLYMLLGAHLRRYPKEQVQIRYEMRNDRTCRVYLEPLELLPETPGSTQLTLVDDSLATLNQDEIFAQASAFQRQSPISDPHRAAIEIISWHEVCSINYVPHRPHAQVSPRQVEGTKPQSLPSA